MTLLLFVVALIGCYAVVRRFELLTSRAARYDALIAACVRVYTWAMVRREALDFVERRLQEARTR